MQQVSLQVADEIKALGDALALLIGDIKAGKPAAGIAADVLPALLPAISGLQAIGLDIKLPENQVYIIYALAKALEPAPVA
jgi:hypothetical protein